jgi:hypothetical protein
MALEDLVALVEDLVALVEALVALVGIIGLGRTSSDMTTRP